MVPVDLEDFLQYLYMIFAFCAALFLGGLKKFAAASVLLGVGYGFFTPWVSTFEAFRHDDESKNFFHCVVDGTWGTIKGSCTVVRDFFDMCYHSFPLYLQELRESPSSEGIEPLRLIHVPGCIIAGILGLVVEIPLYTAIAVVKSPYMLFKGWQRLIHDLVSREGPFLETACIPIAGLTILLWPLVVICSIIAAIFSSVFIGLYASFVVYQERSFKRGIAYVIAMVAEFDEYTNDWLYLREGSILPKPRYRKKKIGSSTELASDQKPHVQVKFSPVLTETPAMIVPRLPSSRSVREAIHEVKMVQVWGNMMSSFEERGRELIDANVIMGADLFGWLKAKNGSDAPIIDSGLPCYSFMRTILYSIDAGSDGLLLSDGLEITHLNRPQDRLFDWFFNPIILLKEQIRVIQLEEGEVKYLEKGLLFGTNTERLKAWDNGSFMPEDALKAAQVEGISRRMVGMLRSVAKFPTYRRKFKQVVKSLIVYSAAKEESSTSYASKPANIGSFKSASVRAVGSTFEMV